VKETVSKRDGLRALDIEKWWLVNPLAFLGIAIAWFWPHARLPHAAHVWLSTWASLFHMTMAASAQRLPTRNKNATTQYRRFAHFPGLFFNSPAQGWAVENL